jgi:hypothetical protein
MGRSIARVGQRLLDTIDGRCPWAPSAPRQPSECQGKHGFVSSTGVHYRTSYTAPELCPDCRGTGHNLRGYLPAIEWPACVRLPVDGLLTDFTTATPLHRHQIREAYELMTGLQLPEGEREAIASIARRLRLPPRVLRGE